MSTQKSNIVLVTGANQGIGFATVKKLATEHPDYHVLLGSRNAERGQEAVAKLKAENLSVEAITIDVTSDSSIAAAAAEVEARFGRLDVLINNAGIANEHKYKTETASLRDVMHECYDVNVFGAMQVLETFTPLLEKSKLPRVVFVSSDLASFGNHSVPGTYPVYRSTKSALNMLVLTYSTTYREKGWKINAVCPGYTGTNLNNYYGTGSVEDGAIIPVRLATIGEDGPTGTFSNKGGPLPW